VSTGGGAWIRWRPEIAKACDGSHQRIEDVERSLAEGRAHLLTLPDCCFVVEIAAYPAATACQVMWGAGELDAIVDAAPRLHAWARRQGCTEMLVEGRAGWVRALKDIGYRPWSVTLRKSLSDEPLKQEDEDA